MAVEVALLLIQRRNHRFQRLLLAMAASLLVVYGKCHGRKITSPVAAK